MRGQSNATEKKTTSLNLIETVLGKDEMLRLSLAANYDSQEEVHVLSTRTFQDESHDFDVKIQ